MHQSDNRMMGARWLDHIAQTSKMYDEMRDGFGQVSDGQQGMRSIRAIEVCLIAE
jgi:hypothetical protein